jgi:pimeloyl-ACP methyl ester carboxylesterase
MPLAIGVDGAELYFETRGDPSNPAIFMGPHFYASREAGEDSRTGRWVRCLERRFFLIQADYPRGIGRTLLDGTACSPDLVVADYGLIADAAGVGKFGWLGYSFGGAVGIQLACRSSRLSALAVGGFPPLDAPFRRIIRMAAEMSRSQDATRRPTDLAMLQATVDFYTPLVDWDGGPAIARLAMPRLAFMGVLDGADGAETSAPLADCLRAGEPMLRDQGWRIAWLPGLDHAGAVRSEEAVSRVEQFFCDSLLRDCR